MLIKRYFKLGRLSMGLNFHSVILPKTKTGGSYNRVPKTPYKVLYLDYDRGMRLEWIEEEIKYFQEQKNLGDFIILQSNPKSNSYHVVCFDYLTQEEENEIVQISNCDDLFKKSPMFDFKSRVLRSFPKGQTQAPRFLKVIKSEFANGRKKSLGHIKFYEALFEIPKGEIDKTNSVDTGVDLIGYPTKKNIKGGKD